MFGAVNVSIDRNGFPWAVEEKEAFGGRGERKDKDR